MGRADEELRRQFPEATARVEESMRRFSHQEEYAHIDVEYCTARVKKGTGQGVCDAALDVHGECPYAGDHLD